MEQDVKVKKATRLFFVDALRAWAILMMLQGHFIDGLLDPVFREAANPVFAVWQYFRGVTAPVFFTVAGFIFTWLLVQSPQSGWENPRVKKGLRRGLQLLLIGYVLRLNVLGLFQGHLYEGVYVVDVLHCIGLSLLCLTALYVGMARKKPYLFPLTLVGVTLLLFVLEPVYSQMSYTFLPTGIANYFTKANGSVFTLLPWLGYVTMGGALAVLFARFKTYKHLYPFAIGIAVLLGYTLVFHSPGFFTLLYKTTSLALFRQIETNNYLFKRLGDVFFAFAFFMALRRFITHSTIVKIGSGTLTLYVIHSVVLYGSFTGWGLYQFFHHALPASVAIPGALAFMAGCTFLALQYTKYEEELKGQMALALQTAMEQAFNIYKAALAVGKGMVLRGRLLLRWLQGVRD